MISHLSDIYRAIVTLCSSLNHPRSFFLFLGNESSTSPFFLMTLFCPSSTWNSHFWVWVCTDGMLTVPLQLHAHTSQLQETSSWCTSQLCLYFSDWFTLIDSFIDFILWLPKYPGSFFSVSLPWKFCFSMPSHFIRNDTRCKHSVHSVS